MNNRQIKFRAWNELPDRSGEMVTEENSGLTSAQILDRFSNVMQFTGLKDRNGVEIYEGDVVWLQNMKKKFVGPVVFDPNKGFQAKIAKSAEVAVGFSFHLKNCNVVGNIHQNPELIK